MTSHRYRACFAAGRRNTNWRRFRVCGSCRAGRRRERSSAPRPHRIAPAHGAPDPAGRVTTHSVGDAGLGHFSKHLAVRQLSGGQIHVEHADMRGVVRSVRETRVYDIELFLVRRKGDAVGFDTRQASFGQASLGSISPPSLLRSPLPTGRHRIAWTIMNKRWNLSCIGSCGKKCSTCRQVKRADIDRRLAAGEPGNQSPPVMASTARA
jgi:hypothetical protein